MVATLPAQPIHTAPKLHIITNKRAHTPQPYFEALEQRTLLAATLFVTSAGTPTDASHFHTLQAALNVAVAGDSIILQQGFSPGNFASGNLTVSASVGATAIRTSTLFDAGNIITIGSGGSDPTERALITAVTATGLGDYLITLASPLALAHNGSLVDATNGGMGATIGINKSITLTAESGVVLPFHLEIWAGTSGVTLDGLNLDDHTLTIGGGGNIVRNSSLNQVLLASGFAGNSFINNTFSISGGDGLSLENNDGTVIDGNTFSITSPFAFGVSVRNSDDVVIRGNSITTGLGGTGIFVSAEMTRSASADIRHNTITTTDGYAIYLAKFDPGASLEARVQGNHLSNNAIGVAVVGDGNLAGIVDLGGGTTRFGTSTGGNNFNAFTSSDDSHFAIGVFATSSSHIVHAKNNLWNVPNPLSVVADSNHTPAAFGTGQVVTDEAPTEVLTANAVNLSTVETGTTTGIVATFRSNIPRVAGDFLAFINWGDGDISEGIVVSDGNGGFSVLGSHKWDQPGSFTFTVTITTGAGGTVGASTNAQGTAAIEERSLEIEAANITVDKKKGFNGTVATFTDNLPGTLANAYTASVAWSDGVVSQATIVKNADGSFSVRTARTFMAAGVIVASVSVSTSDGQFSGTASFTTTVTDKTVKPGCKPSHIRKTIKFIRKVIAKHHQQKHNQCTPPAKHPPAKHFCFPFRLHVCR